MSGVENSSAMYAPTWTKGCVEHRTEAMQEPVYVLPRMRFLRGWVNKDTLPCIDAAGHRRY
jgi:hypothetical protein